MGPEIRKDRIGGRRKEESEVIREVRLAELDQIKVEMNSWKGSGQAWARSEARIEPRSAVSGSRGRSNKGKEEWKGDG